MDYCSSGGNDRRLAKGLVAFHKDIDRNMCAAIIGYGETALGEVPGYHFEELNMWAVKEAMDDAGVTPDDIDGFIASPPFRGNKVGVYPLAEYLGIMPIRWGETNALGGASHLQSYMSAVRAIETGLAEMVLVVSADPFLSRMGRKDAVGSLSGAAGPFEEPANIIPSLYAHAATWHMDTFGTTEEQLAKVAEIGYRHASMQPEHRSHMNEEKSVDEILRSSMIAYPFTRHQCSLISDGGGAFIVASDKKATEHADIPIELAGFGAHHTHRHITQMPDFGRSGAVEAGQQAFSQADVDHEDIDVVEIYDAFTFSVIKSLEDLGFCEQGEGGELVMSGELELGGAYPMNTHGGSLAQAHPGLPSGMFHLIEGVRQLRGEGGKTQVDGAETALVTGNGGIYSTQTVGILERGG